MKTARKLTSLLLALLLVFALAVTAAADGGTGETKGTITVDNPIKGQAYTAYKIFDVVYDKSTPKNYSYTIKSDSKWYDTVHAYAQDTTHGLTLTPVADTTPITYVVTIADTNDTNKFSAPSFADALKKALADGKVTDNGSTLISDGTSVSVNNLNLGYYFVKSDANNALCNLTTTDNIVTIHDKNDVPFKKTDDKDSADVGGTVTYTITGKVPDTTGFEDYTYKIADTMSGGLTFQKDVKVSIGGTAIAADTVTPWIEYTPATGSTTGFELTIPVKNYQGQVGAEITITYSAVVNEKAVAQIEKNQAVLNYSNNPTKWTDTTRRPADEQKVYTSKIVIDKYETDKENNKLPGAIFVLYKRGAETDTKLDGVDYDTVNDKYYPRSYYQYNKATTTEGAKVVWVTDKTRATHQTTDNKGATSFDGLADGTYYLVETEAPAGYNPLTGPVEVKVEGNETETQKLTVTKKIENKTGAVLPSTGGMGTTVFYVLGAVLVLGAGVLLVTKKRMSRNEG